MIPDQIEDKLFRTRAHQSGIAERREMINRNSELSISRQAELLGFSRGMVYYTPKPISEPDLALMHAIDKWHMEHPFMGARMLRNQLQRDGFNVGRQHVRTLMRRMGIHAIYRKPKNTSGQNPAHKIYPYLLRGKQIVANQVWALDTSYIPMEDRKGLVRRIYLLNRIGHHHQSKAAKAVRLVRKAGYSYAKGICLFNCSH